MNIFMKLLTTVICALSGAFMGIGIYNAELEKICDVEYFIPYNQLQDMLTFCMVGWAVAGAAVGVLISILLFKWLNWAERKHG